MKTMQGVNIAAYKRLGDSYAEEHGDNLTEPITEKVTRDGYAKLDGNSDSEEGYQTAADSDSDQSYKTSEGADNEKTDLPTDGYQNSYGPKTQSGHGNLTSYNATENQTFVSDVPDQMGYFRLEGFSEFCGNLDKLKNTTIQNGFMDGSVIKDGEIVGEKQQIWEDPTKVVENDDFEVAASCYFCSFRGLLKMCQILFCVVALSFGLTSTYWVQSSLGIWFIIANVSGCLLAASVLMAQTYGEMDRCCLCRRKLIQALYLLLIPVLLSAGLLSASASSALRRQPLSDMTMIMVASMFTLMALFAVITDVVMHRRMWNMFQMAGRNAYIHAAFMA